MPPEDALGEIERKVKWQGLMQKWNSEIYVGLSHVYAVELGETGSDKSHF